MAEHVIAKVADLQDGQMKGIEVDGVKVLLIRRDGEYSAFSGECTHHGADLSEGVLTETHVRCPWHQACFCSDSGDVMQPPALDALARFDVRVDGDDVVVDVPEDAPSSREMAMAEHDPDADGRTFVVVGTGAAGSAAGEALRQYGFQGRIVMITREDEQPYDRTELSKPFLSKKSPPDVTLRPADFYEKHGIELMTRTEVASVKPAERRIELADGRTLDYDECLLATGAQPRRLPVEGMDLKGVFTLRNPGDAAAIRQAAEGAENIVVIGASFIGTEVAGSLAQRGHTATIVAPEDQPLARVLGSEVGAAFRTIHEDAGNRFQLGARIKGFQGDGSVSAVVLEDGTTIPADLVVLGVGVQPVTDYLDGVEINDDGSVNVDSCMRVTDGLWAAGDIARFPDPVSGEAIRVEHWRLAQQLGRTAAANMAGRDMPYDGVPFFWTNQAGTTLAYVGHGAGWDETIVDGDVASGEGFLVCYVGDGRVQAACAVYRDVEMGTIAELMRSGEMPNADTIRSKGLMAALGLE